MESYSILDVVQLYVRQSVNSVCVLVMYASCVSYAGVI